MNLRAPSASADQCRDTSPRPVREPEVDHRPLVHHEGGDPEPPADLPEAIGQPLSQGVQPLERPGPLQHLEGRQRRRAGDRIAAEGPRVHGEPPALRSGGCDALEQLGAPDYRADRIPSPKRLSQRGQIRHDAVVLLGAPQGQPKPGDHLVEDQGNVALRRDRPDTGQEPRFRRYVAQERLDDHGTQLVSVFSDHGGGDGQIVVGRHQHIGAQRAGHPGRVRLGRRIRDGSPVHGAPDRPVVGPVVGALELQDPVPTGVGPRELHCGRGRLRPGVRELDALGAGNDLDQLLREEHGGGCQLVELGAQLLLGADRRQNLGMRVPQDE